MEINKMEIHFIDSGGGLILRKKLIGLPLKESSIIAKSIECFGDHEPCMIHRSAIMKLIYMEFYDYFDELQKQMIIHQQWCNVPDHLKQMLDINADISCFTLNG